MPLPVTIELDWSDLDRYTGGEIGTPISEKEAAVVLSLLGLADYREAWTTMSDGEWQTVQEFLANLATKLGG